MHDLQSFAENVSIVDGPPVRAMGIPFPTRMIIVKLADGSLSVNSPVSVSSEMLGRIKASGPVRYLVAPTKMHVWRLEEWHELFPEAELWAPPQIPNQFKHLPIRRHPGRRPTSRLGGGARPTRLQRQFLYRGSLFLPRRVTHGHFWRFHPKPPDGEGQAPSQCSIQSRWRLISSWWCRV